jgi:zinc transport system permease protein
MLNEIFLVIYHFLDIVLPFAWAEPVFMKNALIALVLIAPAAALVGIHLTALHMAFFGDAISHSAFTGIALGFLFSVNPSLSMAIFAVAISILIYFVEKKSNIAMDNIISVMMSLGVAAGLCIVSFRKSFMRDFQSYLFGDILTVSQGEIIVMFLVLVFIVIWSYINYNRLALMSLSPLLIIDKAKSRGLSKLLFSLLCAVLVAVSIKVTGMLLITSLLVIPAVTARLIAKSEGRIFRIAYMIIAGTSLFALIVSYYLDMATGGVIIVFLSVLFFIAYLLRAVWKISL